MSKNASILGPKRLNEIAIPGAHDAGTFAIAASGGGALILGKDDGLSSPDNKRTKQLLSMSGHFSKWAKTQERTTAEMLNDGIRYFDIRICVDEKGALMTCHGLYGASLESILDDIDKFCQKYPKELILLGFNHFWDRQFQREKNKGQGEIEGLTTAKWSELVSLIKMKLAKRLIKSTKFSPSSRLDDVWRSADGAQVIALFDTDEVPDDEILWKRKEDNTWFAGWEMNSYKAGTIKILENALNKQYSDRFYAIRSSVTPDDTGKLIGLGLFSKDYPESASELANATNPVVFGWIRNEWRKKYPINLIWADFYNRHGLVDLAKSLNGIKVPAAKKTDESGTKWKTWKEPSKKNPLFPFD